MTRLPHIPAAFALLLLACGQGGVPAAGQLDPVADVKQLMAHILEPAAEVYWDAVGSVVDSSGTKEFAPATDEGWDAVRNSAFVVAETGNLLMLPPRARDDGDWIRFSRDMIGAARKAIAAAESRDPAAVFDVGAEVYETCTQCHARYAVEQLRPNARPQ